MGRASRWTQSSNTLEGRHGGGIEGGLAVGAGDAVAKALTRNALGSLNSASSAHVRGETGFSIFADALVEVSLDSHDRHMLSWRTIGPVRGSAFRGAIVCLPEVCHLLSLYIA